jgi:hypothetical protein
MCDQTNRFKYIGGAWNATVKKLLPGAGLTHRLPVCEIRLCFMGWLGSLRVVVLSGA